MTCDQGLPRVRPCGLTQHAVAAVLGARDGSVLSRWERGSGLGLRVESG